MFPVLSVAETFENLLLGLWWHHMMSYNLLNIYSGNVLLS